MRSGEPWTPEEIEYLIKAYRAKQRAKEIAKAVNRSDLAVYRKIDSLKLRELYGKDRREKGKEQETPRKRESSGGHKIGENKMVVSNLPWTSEIMSTSMEPGIKDETGLIWVEFGDVLKWLKSMDIYVRRSFFKRANYICEGKYLTEAQVLLTCNRYRVANGLSVVHVFGITDIS